MSSNAPTPPHSPGTEQQLREALEVLAAEVHAAPDAYRTARNDWHRREQRRRIVLAGLIIIVFTVATLAGLWVLNQAPSEPSVIFNDAMTVRTAPDPSPARLV
jgi:hypothetical protein